MKIINETKFVVVAKADPTLSQDGKSTYYKIACLQNGQATNVSVSEEIYNEIPDGMVDAVFSTSYDDKYQSFRIDRLLRIVSVNGIKPGDSKPDPKATANAPSKG